MGLAIYADVVFIVNLIMDYFILWVAGYITKKRIKHIRIFTAALIMALMYCVLIFIVNMQVYYNFAAGIAAVMLGVAVAYGVRGANYIKLVVLCHLCAFFIGGMGLALFYFTDVSRTISNITGFMTSFSVKTLLVSVSVFYILLKLYGKWINSVLIKKQTFFPVKIFYNQSGVSINALMDTGNSLHDPVSKHPVIIAEFNSVKEFLPEGVKRLFNDNNENNLNMLIDGVTGSNFYPRVRMIPYASLGRQNGMLVGFRPDKVEIYGHKKTITLQEVVVGICNFKLSGDGSYQGLLNPEVIKA